jgi:hypothetical protein
MSTRGSATALVVCGLAWTSGCGDPRDAQVPLVPDRDPVALPMFAQSPAQAFASIGIQNPDGLGTMSCPLSLVLALGSSCDRITTGDGTCSSVRNGEDAVVRCSILPLADVPSVYDVDLLLGHSLLPRLSVTGPMSDVQALPVTLQVTTSDGVTLDTECAAEALAIQPNLIQFGLLNCTGEVRGHAASRCEVSLSAGFENCSR